VSLVRAPREEVPVDGGDRAVVRARDGKKSVARLRRLAPDAALGAVAERRAELLDADGVGLVADAVRALVEPVPKPTTGLGGPDQT
jgi:hypothetical protein